MQVTNETCLSELQGKIGAEFIREPSVQQNEIFLSTNYNGTRLYLQADTDGIISLVTKEYKEYIEQNCAELIQQCRQLQFDIVFVESRGVTLPAAG